MNELVARREFAGSQVRRVNVQRAAERYGTSHIDLVMTVRIARSAVAIYFNVERTIQDKVASREHSRTVTRSQRTVDCDRSVDRSRTTQRSGRCDSNSVGGFHDPVDKDSPVDHVDADRLSRNRRSSAGISPDKVVENRVRIA